MTRPTLLFAVAMTAAILARSTAPVAHACVGLGPEETVRQAELLVEGRITSWTPASEVEKPSWGNTPIRVELTVTRTLKGQPIGRLLLYDLWSLRIENGVELWGATPTDCPSPFTKDPTGRFVVINAVESETLPGYSPGVMFIGDSPSGASYQTLIASIVSVLPALGGPPGAMTSPDAPVVLFFVAGAAIPLMFLLGAAFVWPRRRSAS